MRLNNLKEFADIISEGFLVDKLLSGNYELAMPFAIDIQIGRKIVKSNNFNFPNILICLRRYNWFMEWLLTKNIKCKSIKEANKIIQREISNLYKLDIEENKLFWKWLSKKTLCECSEMLVQ